MKKEGPKGFIYLAYLGFMLLMPIVGGMFLGILFVRKFNWPNWVPLLFMLLGLFGGIRDLYALIMKDFDNDRR